jgi:hypothetical protein
MIKKRLFQNTNKTLITRISFYALPLSVNYHVSSKLSPVLLAPGDHHPLYDVNLP